jgi:hypothetical protein
LPKRGYRQTEAHKAARKIAKPAEPRKLTDLLPDHPFSDSEIYARFVTAAVPLDHYATFNRADYIDTGAGLVRKADFAALSGPCVVIKAAENDKKSPPA